MTNSERLDTNEELAEAVANRIGKGTTDDWARAICSVARENGVTVARVESAYDAMYLRHLADRGMDQ
jgi:crotonobetainyl-CoA:carnitine CoA-transferase CaiB-like acyl-CoA transferase